MNIFTRETPKIDGSSAAFVVVIVVLVAIIITSCSAVIYILRKNALEDQEAQPRRRYNTHDSDLATSWYSKKWYSYLWSSRDRHNRHELIKDIVRDQTNDREWDASESNLTTPFRISERRSPETSIVVPHICVHSPTSDTASSVGYDPRDSRSLPEQFAISPQATIPSIQSKLCSPTSSSPPSPVPRQIATNTLSHDSGRDSIRDSLPQSLPPTFGSGTKFFESL